MNVQAPSEILGRPGLVMDLTSWLCEHSPLTSISGGVHLEMSSCLMLRGSVQSEAVGNEDGKSWECQRKDLSLFVTNGFLNSPHYPTWFMTINVLNGIFEEIYSFLPLNAFCKPIKGEVNFQDISKNGAVIFDTDRTSTLKCNVISIFPVTVLNSGYLYS